MTLTRTGQPRVRLLASAPVPVTVRVCGRAAGVPRPSIGVSCDTNGRGPDPRDRIERAPNAAGPPLGPLECDVSLLSRRADSATIEGNPVQQRCGEA
ncbi:MAG: hypothetical protein ACOY71_14695 [Gemmatimonadota bacterium]